MISYRLLGRPDPDPFFRPALRPRRGQHTSGAGSPQPGPGPRHPGGDKCCGPPRGPLSCTNASDRPRRGNRDGSRPPKPTPRPGSTHTPTARCAGPAEGGTAMGFFNYKYDRQVIIQLLSGGCDATTIV